MECINPAHARSLLASGGRHRGQHGRADARRSGRIAIHQRHYPRHDAAQSGDVRERHNEEHRRHDLDAGGRYQAGAVGDSDPFASVRQLLASGDAIAPGQSKTFTFNMTAPATPNTYLTDWQMLREGVAWFGEIYSKNVTVQGFQPITYSDTFTNNAGVLNGLRDRSRRSHLGGAESAGQRLKSHPHRRHVAHPGQYPDRNQRQQPAFPSRLTLRDNDSGSIMIGLPGALLGSLDLTNGSLYLEVARNGDCNVCSVTGGVITTISALGTLPGWVINSTHTFEFIYHISPKTFDVKMDGSVIATGVSVGTFVPTLQFAAIQGKRLNDTLFFASGDADFDNFVATIN